MKNKVYHVENENGATVGVTFLYLEEAREWARDRGYTSEKGYNIAVGTADSKGSYEFIRYLEI